MNSDWITVWKDLIAGKGGLDREVNACEIIDFEFADGIEFSREEMFYGNDNIICFKDKSDARTSENIEAENS